MARSNYLSEMLTLARSQSRLLTPECACLVVDTLVLQNHPEALLQIFEILISAEKKRVSSGSGGGGSSNSVSSSENSSGGGSSNIGGDRAVISGGGGITERARDSKLGDRVGSRLRAHINMLPVIAKANDSSSSSSQYLSGKTAAACTVEDLYVRAIELAVWQRQGRQSVTGVTTSADRPSDKEKEKERERERDRARERKRERERTGVRSPVILLFEHQQLMNIRTRWGNLKLILRSLNSEMDDASVLHIFAHRQNAEVMSCIISSKTLPPAFARTSFLSTQRTRGFIL